MGEKSKSWVCKGSLRASSNSHHSVIAVFENTVDKCWVRKRIWENKYIFENSVYVALTKILLGLCIWVSKMGKTAPKKMPSEEASRILLCFRF